MNLKESEAEVSPCLEKMILAYLAQHRKWLL